MPRARLIWIIVAVIGILSGLSVPRAHFAHASQGTVSVPSAR